MTTEKFVRPSWFGITGERMSVPYHVAAASFYDRMKNPHALKKYLQAKKNFRRFAFRRGLMFGRR